MRILLVIFIVVALTLLPFSQGLVIENHDSIEVVNGAINVTFFKDNPMIEIGKNESQKFFYVSSVMFNSSTVIELSNLPWIINFTKIENGIYDFKMLSQRYGYRFVVEYILLLNNQKYMNYTANGIIVHLYINGKLPDKVMIFEHISKDKINVSDLRLYNAFNIHQKTTKLSMEDINYYSKNSSFYILSSNNTGINFYQVCPNKNDTIQSFSFISFGPIEKGNILNIETLIFTVAGIGVGSAIILSGFFYLRKKG